MFLHMWDSVSVLVQNGNMGDWRDGSDGSQTAGTAGRTVVKGEGRGPFRYVSYHSY